MDMQIITAKWKKGARLFMLSLIIGMFIFLVFGGFYVGYLGIEWQMVLFARIMGFIFSLITVYLGLWMLFWKLEIRNNEIIVFIFLKKPKTYTLLSVIAITNNKGVFIKYNGKTIARMTTLMIENCDEIVSAIEFANAQ